MELSGIIVDLILFFMIAGNAVFGYRIGLARVFCKFVSTIAAIILVLILYRPVTNYIINNTNIPERFQGYFFDKISYLLDNEVKNSENVNEASEDSNTYAILKMFVGDEIDKKLDNTKNDIITFISNEISYKIIKILVVLVLFAVIRLVLYVLRSYIEALASIPVINVFNGIGGMIYGILKGFLIIYITLAIITLILPIIGNNVIIYSIENSMIGSKMFNNNILLNLIFK